LKHEKAARKLPKKMFDVDKEGYPPTFFTGRRAFYPTPPGLSDFIDDCHVKPESLVDIVKVLSSRSEKGQLFGEDEVEEEEHLQLEMGGDVHDTFSGETTIGLVRRFQINVSVYMYAYMISFTFDSMHLC
jgi:hypothetical protein